MKIDAENYAHKISKAREDYMSSFFEDPSDPSADDEIYAPSVRPLVKKAREIRWQIITPYSVGEINFNLTPEEVR